MRYLVCIVLLAITATAFGHNYTVAPILVIHGISADCDYGIVDSLKENFETHVDCDPIGGGEAKLASWLYNINYEGKLLCDWLHTQEDYKHGNFSIMGISQGSVVLKYVLEYCPFEQPIRSVVTLKIEYIIELL